MMIRKTMAALALATLLSTGANAAPDCDYLITLNLVRIADCTLRTVNEAAAAGMTTDEYQAMLLLAAENGIDLAEYRAGLERRIAKNFVDAADLFAGRPVAPGPAADSFDHFRKFVAAARAAGVNIDDPDELVKFAIARARASVDAPQIDAAEANREWTKRNPGAISLCPPPHKMTAAGCQ
jgi:hypothetical protein